MINRKGKHIAAIDRAFLLPHRLLMQLTSGRAASRNDTNRTWVLKLVGMGGIIFFGRLCDENKVDKNKITLVTFGFNAAACAVAGFVSVRLIRTTSIFHFFGDCLGLIKDVRKERPGFVIDFERCSYAVGTFSRLLAVIADADSIAFHSPAVRSHQRHQVVDASTISYRDMFLHGISVMPRSSTPHPSGLKSRNRKILININAGAYLPERKYPLNQYARVIKMLSDQLEEFEFFLTGSAAEVQYVLKAAEVIRSPRVHAVAGQWSVARLAEEIAHCALCITNDSGPLHLAVKYSTPTVAIWGPTQPRHFGYDHIGHLVNVTLDLPCSPCFLHVHSAVAAHCEGRVDCFRELSPERVVLAATSMIKKLTEQWDLAHS